MAFNRESQKRIANVTRRIEKTPINLARRTNTRKAIPESGKCLAYKYEILVLGEPSSGDFELSFTWANDAVGTSGVETITVDYNFTVSQMDAALAALEGVEGPQGQLNWARTNGLGVSGEDFPLGAMYCRLIGNGLGGRLLELQVSSNSLSGGASTRVRITPVCC